MPQKLLNLINKKRTIAIVVLSMILVIGIYSIYISNLSYAVILNGKEIGITNNKDEIPVIVESINLELNNKSGEQIDELPELTYVEVWGGDRATDSIESITMTAESTLGLKSEAYALNVDGKDLFYFYSEEDAHQTLERLKDNYLANISGGKTKDIEFIENISIIQKSIASKDIITSDEGFNHIITGKEEIQKYTVKKGDTASQIAIDFDISLTDMTTANPDVNINKLQIGQILNLNIPKPLISVKIVEEIEYIEAIPFGIKHEETSKLYIGESKTSFKGSEGKKKVKADITYINGIVIEKSIVEENIIEEPSSRVILKGTTARPKTLAYGKFHSPTRGSGRISSRFGPRWGGYHKGLDIANPTGTPIVAADGGKVVYSGWKGDYGYLVVIDHENGYETYYAHNSSILVKKGQRVYRGQIIAKVGNTGKSTGPHLHFEVRKNGKPTDPLKFISY